MVPENSAISPLSSMKNFFFFCSEMMTAEARQSHRVTEPV